MVDVSPSIGVEGAGPATPSESRFAAAVAVGGAVGASARWVVGELLHGADEVGTVARFPWGTLFVNVTGCLLIAIAASRIARSGVGWAFWVTGGLGGFTTMSAVAVELNDAADAGRTAMLAAYLAATLVGSALAFGVGDRVARRGQGWQRTVREAEG